VGHSHPSPPPGDRHKDLWQLLNELGLLFRRQHQVAVALLDRGQRREDPSAHAEIHCTHVRTFLCAVQAQRYPPKIERGHRTTMIQ
jgi:hypothetical protein